MPSDPDAEPQARAIAEAYAAKLARAERCAECQVPGHDICPLREGCPCCDDTRAAE